MAPDARLLKESLARVESHADQMALHFYALLFWERPELRNLFPAAMDAQRDRFFRALLNIIHGADRAEFLEGYLAQLARDHRKYDVRPDHYEAVGRALIGALRHALGDSWTTAMEREWSAMYDFAARVMIEATEQDAAENPPWWAGEVVSHDQRTRDIAVLTLRPYARLPYTAGQYVSVETARWPRVWRSYSIANAPHSHGLIDLHVRSVGAGWVSNALVHHTKVGDTVRLGPARGSMTPDTASERPVLCVAGGTGLAPIKALSEELTRSDPERPVHVFFGARQQRDLYDLQSLVDLSAWHPRLVVVPAVSHEASSIGEHGLVTEVVTRYGRWDAYDVYACGSPDMVRATVEALHDQGVPLSRIRYDDFG